MNTLINNNSDIDNTLVRTNVSKLINTDLNLIHRKIKKPLADINTRLWKDRIQDGPYLPSMIENNNLSWSCIFNILTFDMFKCSKCSNML